MSNRCYTTKELLDALNMPRSTFGDLKRAGRIPFLEEIRPRIGRVKRYRAEPVDRYLENRFREPLRRIK